MHRWAWQPRRGQGSAVGGGLAAAGWAEQEERQAGVGALLGGELGKVKSIWSRRLLAGGPVAIAGLEDESWEAGRNGRLASRKESWR